jgi:hypothetical protein
LKTIARLVSSTPKKTSELRSPKSAKAIHRFYAMYDKDPTVDKVKKLFSTTLHLSAQVAILRHENRSLYNAIELQKKKNCHGVRLNLAGEENKDKIDCWSLEHVVKAKEYQAEKEALAAAKEQEKYERKIQRAANALRKKQEQAEKQYERAIKKAEAEAKAAQKQLAKDLAAASKAAKKTTSKNKATSAEQAKNAAPILPVQQKLSFQPRQGVKQSIRPADFVPPEQVDGVRVVATKTASRTINLPQRFR